MQRAPWGILLALLVGAAGCGKSPSPELTAVPIQFTHPHSVLNVPFWLGERLQLFQQQGLALQAGTGSLRVGPAASPPITGIIAQRSDELLIAPVPDVHFRLQQLNELPVTYLSHSDTLTVTNAVLALHRIRPRTLESLSTTQALAIWPSHTLPYLIISLNQFPKFLEADPKTAILAVFSASTGNIPAWVVSGMSPHLPPLLQALNLSLWYLHSHSPAQVGAVLSGVDHLDRQQWQIIIQKAQQYQYWPETTLPMAQAYDRWRKLWDLNHPKNPLPPYKTAVVSTPALAAIARTR